MNRGDAREVEVRGFRDRLYRLSKSHPSHQREPGPARVLDSARSLNGAGYGAFMLLDDSAEIRGICADGSRPGRPREGDGPSR